MFLVAFCLRYLDIFFYFISFYNLLMKIFFICATMYTIYLIRWKSPYCYAYDPKLDNFQHYYFIYPTVFGVTLIIHTSLKPLDFVWSYSLWLEAVAFIPQIALFKRIHNIDKITSHYVACLGMYRFFYLINWIFKYFAHYTVCYTFVLAAILQTCLYIELLYYYFKSVREGKRRMNIPLRVKQPESFTIKNLTV